MKRKLSKTALTEAVNDNLELNSNVITLSPFATPLFKNYSFVVYYGGRGSGKSFTFAQAAVLLTYSKKTRIVCARAFLKSLDESVYSEIVARIEELDLTEHFFIKRNEIICKHNGSKITFMGIDRNIDSIKSFSNIDILWIEEADIVTKAAWMKIKPTIRKEGSCIWISFNPNSKDDVIYQEFVVNEPPPNSYVKELHWTDNPYLSDRFHADRLKLLKDDPAVYSHVYDGQLYTQSEAQVFHGKWRAEDFEEDSKQRPYIGLDFGYSVDPTVAIRSYIKDNKLYITHEAYKVKLEIDDIGDYCNVRIPDFKRSLILADNARPETISFMRRQGYRIEGAEKGKGSIEDGIAFIRSFDEIIVHPRCVETIKELTLYSYKIDKKTEEITTKIEDTYNHCIDALRYSLRKLMAQRYADYKALTTW